VRASRRSLEGELAAGTLDLAVDVLLPVSDAVKFTRITVDGAAVVARQGHPAIQGSVDIDTYLAQRHVLVTTRRQGPGFEDIELRRLGMQRQVALRCQYYFAACRTVSQTDLVLTMPELRPHGQQDLQQPGAADAGALVLHGRLPVLARQHRQRRGQPLAALGDAELLRPLRAYSRLRSPMPARPMAAALLRPLPPTLRG
jgi:hypothetical protein